MNTVMEELNGIQYDANQLLWIVWARLICNLFKDRNIINVYTSDEARNDMLVDIVLQISENHCNLQVVRKNVRKRLKHSETRQEKNNIIYAKDLVNAWIILENIWNTFQSEYGEEVFLILTPINQVNSESVYFVRKAWRQLSFFSVLVADTTLLNSSSNILLNVLIANPYNLINNSSESSYIKFGFTKESAETEWITLVAHLKNRIKNLNGYPVKIVMHNFKGLSVAEFDKTGKIIRFIGREAIVTNEYAKYFNFTPIYSLPRDGIVQGGQMKNGSYSGGVRDVEDGVVDISGNSKMLTIGDLKNSRHLRTTDQTSLVIAVPKSRPQVKIIGTLLSVLDGNVSKISILFITLIIITWTGARVTNDKIVFQKEHKMYGNKEKFNALIEVILDNVCILNNTSFNIPSSFKERIFFISLSVWAMAVTNIYIGTITTRLAIRETSEIDTLEQLDQSGLKIQCMKYACRELTIEPGNENNTRRTTRQLLSKKVFVIFNPSRIPQRIAYDRDTTVVCPKYVADTIIEETLSEDGAELIHVMKETVREMYLSQVVRKGWPLVLSLEKIQTLMTEGGLLNYWQKSMKYDFILERFRRSSSDATSTINKPLILNNFRFTFLLWGFLMAISIVVFIIELLCYWNIYCIHRKII